MDRSPRIIIAADSALACEALGALVEADGRFRVSHRTHDGADALQKTRELWPDVLVIDSAVARFPDGAKLREVAGGPQPTGLLLLTATLGGPTISLAIDIGARGFVLKNASAQTFLSAVATVAAQHCWVDRGVVPDVGQALYRRCPLGAVAIPWRNFGLTQREREIVAAVTAACANKEIAHRFGISETTVKHHLTSIFGKVGVSNRLELARFALSSGLHAMSARRAPLGQAGSGTG